jgi:hypothetical protein
VLFGRTKTKVMTPTGAKRTIEPRKEIATSLVVLHGAPPMTTLTPEQPQEIQKAGEEPVEIQQR